MYTENNTQNPRVLLNNTTTKTTKEFLDAHIVDIIEIAKKAKDKSFVFKVKKNLSFEFTISNYRTFKMLTTVSNNTTYRLLVDAEFNIDPKVSFLYKSAEDIVQKDDFIDHNDAPVYMGPNEEAPAPSAMTRQDSGPYKSQVNENISTASPSFNYRIGGKGDEPW